MHPPHPTSNQIRSSWAQLAQGRMSVIIAPHQSLVQSYVNVSIPTTRHPTPCEHSINILCKVEGTWSRERKHPHPTPPHVSVASTSFHSTPPHPTPCKLWGKWWALCLILLILLGSVLASLQYFSFPKGLSLETPDCRNKAQNQPLSVRYATAWQLPCGPGEI